MADSIYSNYDRQWTHFQFIREFGKKILFLYYGVLLLESRIELTSFPLFCFFLRDGFHGDDKKVMRRGCLFVCLFVCLFKCRHCKLLSSSPQRLAKLLQSHIPREMVSGSRFGNICYVRDDH